jgi:MoaA/NifB/PqqE/SkfB family radical SAM enzyme
MGRWLSALRRWMSPVGNTKSYLADITREQRASARALGPAKDAGKTPSDHPTSSAAQQDTFCVLAWNHLQIAPNGTVKMCCIASEDVSDGDRIMSLYTDTYDEIWNSQYMRDARRGLATGEKISPCRRCFDEEASVGESRRTMQNAAWLPRLALTQPELIAAAKANDWRVPERPSFLQLNMGNLCNLACRMCSSQYSSKIENDPVHNKWMPAAYPDVARWRGKKLHLGPRPYFGVSYRGFHQYEVGGNLALRWCSGAGSLRFKLPEGTLAKAVGLSLRTIGVTVPTNIRINGIEVFNGDVTPEWTGRFALANLHNQPEIELEIESVAADIGGRAIGVGLLDVWIEREKAAHRSLTNERTLMRTVHNKGWWAQPEMMFDEVLGSPDKLRYLILQGGEPFLVKEFELMLDVLIENGSAREVTLEIVSNLTVLRQSVLAKLAHVKQVLLGASIDGIGPILEYIRTPAVWANIEDNLDRIMSLPNVVLSFNTAVQAYNLLDMPNILRYGDKRGIDVHTHFLVGPAHLNVSVLPRRVRQSAIDLLQEYLADIRIRPANRSAAVYMIKFLTNHLMIHTRHDFPTFVRFTNDLDVSRGQNFRTLYSELIECFAADGLEWTDDTAYAERAEAMTA